MCWASRWTLWWWWKRQQQPSSLPHLARVSLAGPSGRSKGELGRVEGCYVSRRKLEEKQNKVIVLDTQQKSRGL